MQLLLRQEEYGLAKQIPFLPISNDVHAAMTSARVFTPHQSLTDRTAPARNVDLDPASGMIILDVVHESIRFVEVLNRDDVKKKWTASLT